VPREILYVYPENQTQNYLCEKSAEILSLHSLVRHYTTRPDRVRNITVMYVVEDSTGMKWRRVTFG